MRDERLDLGLSSNFPKIEFQTNNLPHPIKDRLGDSLPRPADKPEPKKIASIV